MSILHTFATNLKKHRTAKGFSQEKLAEITGLHRTYICAIESEKRNISLQNIQRIATALEISPDKLFVSPSE